MVILFFICVGDCQFTYYQLSDMIKMNESDVGDIGFEILAKAVFQFLCFILFLALTNEAF